MKNNKRFVTIFFFLAAAVCANAITMRLPLVNGSSNADSISVQFELTYNAAGVQVMSQSNAVGAGVLVLPEAVEMEGTSYPVISIAQYAFNYCTSLTGIVLPPSLIEVGQQAFFQCTNLQTVNWTDLTNLQYIRMNAFAQTGLTNLSLPASLVTMDSQAFASCEQLTSVDFSNTHIQNISSYTFAGCGLRGELHLPEGLNTLEKYAFQNNTGITAVYVPASMTGLFSGAFSGCTGVTDVYFLNKGSGTQWLNDYKDFNTNYTCSVTFHVSQNIIDECAADTRTDNFKRWYDHCPASFVAEEQIGPGYNAGLLEIDLLDGAGAKSGSVQAEMIVADGEETHRTVRLENYRSETVTGSGKLVIPDSVTIKGKRYAVAQIGESAFSGCTAITALRLPQNLEQIRDHAFRDCPIGGELIFPEGMTYVAGFERTMPEYEADFEAQSHITSVSLPSTIDTIGYEAFAGNEIVNLVIPANCRYIGGYAFANSNNLRSVTFAGTALRKIAAYAFAGYWRVNADMSNRIQRSMKAKSIVLPEGLEEIGNYAFYENDSLESITLPASLRVLGERVFNVTPALTTIILPLNSQLETIGTAAFAESNLSNTTLHFPQTLMTLGDQVFLGSQTKEIFIPKSVQMMGSRPWERTAFGRLIFEDGYRFAYHKLTIGSYPANDTIPSGTFAMCGQLEGSTIVLPEGVKCIAENAFSEADIDSIVLPSTLREIGDYAFYKAGLTSPVLIPASVRIVGEHAFNRVSGVIEAVFPQTHPDSILWRSPDGNDFATPSHAVVYVDRTIYNQCKAGVREDAFQYWFTFSDGGNALQKIAEEEQPVEVQPTLEPTAEEPVEVVDFAVFSTGNEQVDNYALENTVVDDILYNLLPDEGDGIVEDEEEHIHVLQLASVMPIEMFISAVANCIPGSAAWADNFNGISFLIPAGEGVLTLDLKVTGDFKLVIYIGEACTTLTANDQGTVDIAYQCTGDTWVHIFGTAEGPQFAPTRLRDTQTVQQYARIRSIAIGPKQNKDAIEQVENNPSKTPNKFIREGQFFIEQNGRIFNAQGVNLSTAKGK